MKKQETSKYAKKNTVKTSGKIRTENKPAKHFDDIKKPFYVVIGKKSIALFFLFHTYLSIIDFSAVSTVRGNRRADFRVPKKKPPPFQTEVLTFRIER